MPQALQPPPAVAWLWPVNRGQRGKFSLVQGAPIWDSHLAGQKPGPKLTVYLSFPASTLTRFQLYPQMGKDLRVLAPTPLL